MLSRFTSSAVAAVLVLQFAGVSINSAIAAPAIPNNESVVQPAVAPSAEPAVASPGTVKTDSSTDTDSGLEAERARLNSAVLPPPTIGLSDTANGALLRIPYDDFRSRSSSLELNQRFNLDPRGEERYGPRSLRGQEAVDRIGDLIHPGFGRYEFDMGKNHVRIDYLYSKRCHLRGAGICFRMSF